MTWPTGSTNRFGTGSEPVRTVRNTCVREPPNRSGPPNGFEPRARNRRAERAVARAMAHPPPEKPDRFKKTLRKPRCFHGGAVHRGAWTGRAPAYPPCFLGFIVTVLVGGDAKRSYRRSLGASLGRRTAPERGNSCLGRKRAVAPSAGRESSVGFTGASVAPRTASVVSVRAAREAGFESPPPDQEEHDLRN